MDQPAATAQRIIKLLEEAELLYSVDDDGEIRVAFDAFSSWFSVRDTIIRSYAYLSGEVPRELLDDALMFAMECNSDHVWVKSIVLNFEDAGLTEADAPTPEGLPIALEFTSPVAEGMSTDQLRSLIQATLAGFTQCAERWAERFPEHISAAE